ncbi:MAG: transposase domain-containing protein [Thermosynechococcaceae cyanobacterium MS004]|nr:transposase domain-containing protein [Thermosynechococcaceae cyanobacterium MS004]
MAQEKVQYRNCIYSPIVTLWTMMAQVLEPDKSLSNAVKRISAWIAGAGGEVPSPNTGACSKARQRFSARVL